MNDASKLLNFISCLVIALGATILLLRLYDSRKGDTRFVYRSYTCWMASWWIWVLLWGLSMWMHAPGHINQLVLLSLSDANTIFLILFYLGMTRGRTYEPGRYVIHGVICVLFNFAVLVSLYALTGLNEQGVSLHERWSLALGMFSPVLVGWAFKLRYRTNLVLIAGLTYAASQPVAYAALFGKVFTDERGDAILSALAILKLGWAAAATYYSGLAPLSTETLIRLPTHDLKEKPTSSWRMILVGIIAVGAIAIAIVMKSKNMAMLGWLGVCMAGVIGFVGFLAVLEKIASVAQKWVGSSTGDHGDH